MKYLLGISFVISILFPAVSQQAGYSIDFKDEPLDQVLEVLKEQYQIKFSFDPEFVSGYKLTLRFATDDREAFLSRLMSAFPLQHKKVRDVYVILPKEQLLKRRFYGRVADAADGSPLAFAFVRLSDAQTLVTDQNGNFSTYVKQPRVSVEVSYLGYLNTILTVTPDRQKLVINMQPDDNQLPEFIIDESRNNGNKIAGFSSINPNQISTLPALGETDIFKGLQLLPGVTATDYAASGLTVRGSTPEQNLVLLDGFTIYHLDHFFGVFSTFNPNTINHVDIYKGGFDVKYGGRVSAVVDAKAKAWAGDRLRGGVNVNSTSVSTFLQSPVGKKSFINAGLRWSHYGLITNPLYDEFIERNRVDAINLDNPAFNSVKEINLEPDFVFYDFNLKWRYAPNDKETWDFNVYLSEDDYEGLRPLELEFSNFLLQDNAFWSNTGLSTNWYRDWTDNYSTEATLSYSGYNGNASLLMQETFGDSVDISRVEGFQFIDKNTIFYQNYQKFNEIVDVTFKWHNQLRLNDNHDLSFGLETKVLDTDLSIVFPGVSGEEFPSSGTVSALYLSDTFRKGKLGAVAGLRYNYTSNTDGHFLEPRLNVSYQLNDQMAVYGNYSYHNQFINRVSSSPFGNGDQFYWVLGDDEEYPIMRSRHLILGSSYERDQWQFEVEAYRKRTTGVLESTFVLETPFNGRDRIPGEDLEIPNGSTITNGIDFLIKRKSDRHVSWVSYTLSDSKSTFELLNGGRPFASNFDQRHEVNWVNTYKVGKWEFSSVFVYGSGRPFTSRGAVNSTEIILFDIENYNRYRLPDYHRLDLSAKYKTNIGKLQVESGITLFNLYGRENVRSRRFALRYVIDPESDNQVNQVTAFPAEVRSLGFTPNFFMNLSF